MTRETLNAIVPHQQVELPRQSLAGRDRYWQGAVTGKNADDELEVEGGLNEGGQPHPRGQLESSSLAQQARLDLQTGAGRSAAQERTPHQALEEPQFVHQARKFQGEGIALRSPAELGNRRIRRVGRRVH